HYHDWEPFCVSPMTPELGAEVTLRVRTSAKAGVLLLERFGEVERRPLQAVPDGLEITLPMHASPIRYCFFLPEEKVYLTSGGPSSTMPRY
ncbi:glycoside hydrolase family 13 protein, partial [Salmonella sp. zj-f50]